MTVKRLKELLKDLPDDLEVHIRNSHNICGGGTYYQDMPISQYGKTWAIYLKDLPAKIRKKVEEYGK